MLVYPNLFPASPPASCTLASFFKIKYTIDQKEMTAVNKAGAVLDGIISKAVQTASNQGIDIQAVDARPDFTGHEECTTSPWFNGVECVTRSTASTPARRASSSSPTSSRPSRNERFQARPEPR